MLILVNLILCISLGLCLYNVEAGPIGKPRTTEVPDLPESSDIQQLAEALYFDRHILYGNAFPRNRKRVDVCSLPADTIMKFCRKIEGLYKYKGDYTLQPDSKIEGCKTYEVKLHHTLQNPAYESMEVRKCPFQPAALFMLSGNTRVPVFILKWSDSEKKHIHIDYYLDVTV